MKAKPNDPRAKAVAQVARDTLRIELDMEHKDAAQTVSVADLRRALEQAYDLGRKSALS